MFYITSDRLVSEKSKTNLLVKTMIPCEILKQKCFLRNSCFNGFARFQINVSGGEFIFREASKIQSLTLLKKDSALQYFWEF